MFEIILWVVGIAFVGLLILGGIEDHRQKKEAQERRDSAQRLLNLTAGKDASVHLSRDRTKGLALSEDGKTIAAYTGHGLPHELKKSDIVSAELIKDGTTIQKTNRGSQAVGAIAGAALFGPLGAAVGAVTGTKSQVERISSITLRIVLRVSPHYVDIEFFSGKPTDSQKIADSLRNAQNAMSLVQSVIR
jgi:hypothetical protein